MATCPTCQGMGTTSCCATGYHNCQGCNGSGQRDGQTCGGCSGRGRFACTTCNGSRQKPCPDPWHGR